jgi:hypothetical protein
MSGPLADVRVLDLTSVVMGPFATQILGDLGAEVITVEDVKGDTNRTMGVGPHPQFSGVALNLMRNKRNISPTCVTPTGWRRACAWPRQVDIHHQPPAGRCAASAST